ncbi:DUF3093 domain-containing protein [Microbacterium flavum]|uniref:DUF3093 domain-containing protein n=1 Tax=Microbacterium flavum TaxID=415216 RepID=A0ABS5XXD2_9MICO|nr:DUF3093 domain-containing protein [Microbacterium flavum]MBT8799208.1 DUF3093 domain-containing protein [Microbacterium flavum]
MHPPTNADTTSGAPAADHDGRAVIYRERLSPSLWTLLSAAVAAPMVSLVFVPLDATVALVAGLVAAAAILVSLVLLSPVVEVRDGELRVGRAHIPVALLGDPEAFTGDEARHLRGPGLSGTAWHMLRGGIDGVVVVPVRDERDPVTVWVFSTRTPDRVVYAIGRARRG